MEIFNTAPLSLPRLPDKARVTLLALGDVGSTLLMGLRLLGGDVISSLGICDVRENVASRWEFELDQIAPPEGGPLPEADVIAPEQLFDGDVFLFCASRMIPDTSVVQGDVRMAQYALNRELVGHYARMAREKQYRGLFVVVSDPVDPLCRWALRESNKNQRGDYDGLGLSPAQIRGFGLGVMHARALYFAHRDPRFASYLTEGRAFGPHGEDLVLANSLTHYDDALSRELTEKVAHANLEMRKLGFKPYVCLLYTSSGCSTAGSTSARPGPWPSSPVRSTPSLCPTRASSGPSATWALRCCWPSTNSPGPSAPSPTASAAASCPCPWRTSSTSTSSPRTSR